MVKIWRQPPTRQPAREVLALPEGEVWHPLIFDRSKPEDAAELDGLITDGKVVFIHDTLDAQMRDLAKTRTPGRPWTDDEQAAAVVDMLRGKPLRDHGRWVFYPWSRRLVHVLAPAEFSELRTDRNRVKITPAEQAKLLRLKVGIVGLSVGNAIAVTLALESLFGELRLADFDTLDLSNMNRLRCTVDQIGLFKVVICARQIFEMNPYANLTLFPEGATKENIGAFFDDGGRLDVAIDECDSVVVKFKLREEARARRVPLLMETSDRGMLDIERFDLEPRRPLLHGLVGDMTSDFIEAMPPPARLGVILKIVGEAMSPRLAASLLEFGRTLRGFSQLGSDVTLGGATTSHVVRRIGLGQPTASGRVYVDMSAMFANVQPPTLPPDVVAANSAAKQREFIGEMVGFAVMAPSDGNLQPWKFRWKGDRLHVARDVARSGGEGDEFGAYAALVAIGAALENITIAAAARGRTARVELFPAPFDPELVATVAFEPRKEGAAEDPLFEQIALRRTNRRPSTRTSLNQVHVQVLMEAARQQGARLQLCQDRGMLGELGRLLGETDRMQLLSPKLHPEQFARLRWSVDEVQQTRDGLDVTALELGPGMELFFKLLSQPPVAATLGGVRGGSLFAAPAAAAVSASAAVGLLTVEGTSPSAIVRGGRAMQHLWLTATALGLAVHPWNSAINLFARIERYQGAKLAKDEVRTLTELREQFMRFYTVSLSDTEIVLFRLGYAEAPATRSLRRPVDTVLSFEA